MPIWLYPKDLSYVLTLLNLLENFNKFWDWTSLTMGSMLQMWILASIYTGECGRKPPASLAHTIWEGVKHVRPTIDSHSGDNVRLDPDIHRLVRESTNIDKHSSHQHIVSVHCREEGFIGKKIPRGPRDFPRAGILHPEARGQSWRSRGVYFPMHADLRQNTAIMILSGWVGN